MDESICGKLYSRIGILQSRCHKPDGRTWRRSAVCFRCYSTIVQQLFRGNSFISKGEVCFPVGGGLDHESILQSWRLLRKNKSKTKSKRSVQYCHQTGG